MLLVPFAALVLLAPASASSAGAMSHGAMAAAIRSAGQPCAHVLSLESTADNAWRVECNSGRFDVSRDRDGRFTVTPAD